MNKEEIILSITMLLFLSGAVISLAKIFGYLVTVPWWVPLALAVPLMCIAILVLVFILTWIASGSH